MKKIDRETVQRILDTADIVEVVSDFVSLKKRGVNYIGLCPFHNERTPSFSVSKAKGICKCFSCGKGGSPLNFIMEHEQMTYYEALKYLAKKYNIEIKERDMTDQEKEEATERESLLAVNDFALQHFQDNLTKTDDGRDIGLSYFRERGINDLMISKFKLGYALDRPTALHDAAVKKGFSEKYLFDTGLCSKSESGKVYDRFRGRVIYPVFSVSGRTIAFGGRTLRNDKTMAKYVNSPESLIYHKSRELYGLYQAKSSIVKKDKCILVEGYMDVISMHQVGVENVVASSGTSLTEGQIRMIHRFTQNVTVIYDSDAAGIKASLRGIDMLLTEGLNIKVLLLPDGEDPDSFAQSHSSSEVEAYIADHETDFISFKTEILLTDAGRDPVQRAKVISEIVNSIACIPDAVTRAVYLAECSRRLQISEKVLSLQLSKVIATKADKKSQVASAEEAILEIENPKEKLKSTRADRLRQHEMTIAKYIVRYGLLPIANDFSDDEESQVSVISYIQDQLSGDGIELTNYVCNKLYCDAIEIEKHQWPDALAKKQHELNAKREEEINAGMAEIREKGKSIVEMENMEKLLRERLDQEYNAAIEDYATSYLSDIFLSLPDDDERQLATQLANEKYHLSKVHTKYAHIETERERLYQLVERSVLELKFEILDLQINDINEEIKANVQDSMRTEELMKEIFELYKLKAEFSKILGDRIVNPKS